MRNRLKTLLSCCYLFNFALTFSTNFVEFKGQKLTAEELFNQEAWPNEEIILNHEHNLGASATLPDSHQAVERKPLVGIDKLCPKTSDSGDCLIEDKQLRFTSDIFFETDKSIIFKASKVKCLSVDYKPCMLHLKIKGEGRSIVLQDDSILVGQQIIIEAPDSQLQVLDTSTLWASGQSFYTKGTSKEIGTGASYIGMGGSCQEKETQDGKVYGNFNMRPLTLTEGKNKGDIDSAYSYMMGSIGTPNDVETAGGGRIVISVESVVLKGEGQKLQANARPYKDFSQRSYSLAGGTGGYIYVKTTNSVNKNDIDSGVEISATGGYSMGNNGSGSGGVIVFDEEFHLTLKNVHASGGKGSFESENQSDASCINGAAGTIFMVKNNTLVVDNEKIVATRPTVVEVPEKQKYEEVPFICDKLSVQQNGRLLVRGEHKNLGFREVGVHDQSWLKFGESQDKIHLHMKNKTFFSPTSTLDLRDTQWVGIFSEDQDGEREVTLGNVLYQNFFGVKADTITISGKIEVETVFRDSDAFKKTSKLLFEGNVINLLDMADVNSAYTLLQAEEEIVMEQDTKITSYIENTCNLNKASDEIFQCIKKFSLEDKFTLRQYLDIFNEQFPNAQNYGPIQRFNETLPDILNNYTVFLISFGDIDMRGSKIEGSRIAMCSNNLLLDHAKIVTSRHGCESDNGFGKGFKNGKCGASGASHGGSGGYGGIQSTSSTDHEECLEKGAAAYFAGETIKYEGSGGASGTQNAKVGGSGGGIVMINTLQTTKVNRAIIEANGGNGVKLGTNEGSGGGAGGAIQLVTTNLIGSGVFEAKGGDGSSGGGGGGAGGRFVINFLKGHIASSQPEQSHFWTGTYSLEGGQGGSLPDRDGYLQAGSGERGVIESSKCFGGYSGPFCEACPIGTFKYDYSYAQCKPCQNKPDNSYYNQMGASSSNCGYECSDGLDKVESNPYCLSPLELQVTRMGGVSFSLIIFGSFMLSVLLIWIALVINSKIKARRQNAFIKNVYDGVLFTDNEMIDATEAMPTENDLRMKDSDIWSHTARMYLIGENSVSFPWYIPRDFPSQAIDVQSRDKFLKFIKTDQNCLQWTTAQKDIYLLTRLLFPPISNIIHRCFRKKHFNTLQAKVYENFDRSFWDERSQKTLRLSASTQDNQLAYIDFLNYEKAKQDYIGPQIPITLLLAGSGTFNSPYYLNFEDDALAKSLVYFHRESLKTRLPLFFENLNTLLGKLSFYKFTRATMRDLSEVIEWIEMGNKTLFNPLDIKATLYMFENSYSPSDDSSAFTQRRRSFPLESVVLESFPTMFVNLIKFVQTKLLSKKSEIRLGLVFKPYNLEKKRLLLERIRKINENNAEGSEGVESCLIYGSDQDEDQEPIYPQKKFKTSKSREPQSLGDIRRANQMQESTVSLLDESKMLESTVNIFGLEEQIKIKIYDKSKRAFDVSSDSTKALEMTLQKSRSTCKYSCQRFNAWFYAVFVLAFKYHGKPPSRSTSTCFLLVFSFFLTLDILLTLNVISHFFTTHENQVLYGVPFLLIYPGVTILGPLLGVIGSLTGSTGTLKQMSSVNATAAFMNYPLTLGTMIYHKDEAFFVGSIVLLWINKILISYFSSKVRQHLLNPTFMRNSERIEERFHALVHARAEILEGIKPSISQSDRASSLVKSGLPKITKTKKKQQKGLINSLDDSDDDKIDDIQDKSDIQVYK